MKMSEMVLHFKNSLTPEQLVFYYSIAIDKVRYADKIDDTVLSLLKKRYINKNLEAGVAAASPALLSSTTMALQKYVLITGVSLKYH